MKAWDPGSLSSVTHTNGLQLRQTLDPELGLILYKYSKIQGLGDLGTPGISPGVP